MRRYGVAVVAIVFLFAAIGLQAADGNANESCWIVGDPVGHGEVGEDAEAAAGHGGGSVEADDWHSHPE